MGFLDRLLGREPDDRRRPPGPDAYRAEGHDGDPYGRAPYRPGGVPGGGAAHRTPDQRAIERYRYLLATAPPEAVEQAHAEAFARLTPEQRRQVLQQLAEHVPPAERRGDDPASLARMATRTEMRRPGTLERTLGGGGGYGAGPGFGAMVGGSLLGTVAGVVVGSAIADALFGPAFGDLGSDGFAEAGEGADAAGADDAGAGSGTDGGDHAGEEYGGDAGGGDFGGDFGGGDFGGDFGGGDFV